MKSFSFRRMAMFCRLQAGELYFRQPWKSAAALALIVVFVTALPLLSGNGSMEEMMAESEDLVKVLITGQIVFLYLDLVSERRAIGRMMIPATYLEKYAALYAGAALAGIIMTVFASVVGGAVYLAAGHFLTPGQDGGMQFLFFRDGGMNMKDFLVLFLVSSAVPWAIPFVRRRKRYRPATVPCTLAAYFLTLFLPGLLAFVGVIPPKAAKVLTSVIVSALTAVNLVWGYAMLKKYESDQRYDD